MEQTFNIDFVLKSFTELTTSELYQFLKLRSEVFVVEQACIYLDTDDKDVHSFHLLGFQNQELVAYARIIPPGVSYPVDCSIGRVCSKKTHRSMGVGKLLMLQAIKACQKLFPEKNIKISAQSYLLAFYGNLGFKACGEEYLEDNIPHNAMYLEF